MTSNPDTTVATRVTPDVTGMKMAHRAMIHDTRRFGRIAEQIAAGSPCPPRRAGAIAEYLNLLCDSIHHHHTLEDDLVWPVLLASASSAVGIHELEDDHAHLDPLLTTLRERVAAFAAADADKQAAAAGLAEALNAVHDLLVEHVAEEERIVFPLIDQYVDLGDWARIEKAAKKGGNMKFEVPRMLGHATEQELVKMKQEVGPVMWLLLALVRRPFDKRERVIAG